jgi:hypothetical protein
MRDAELVFEVDRLCRRIERRLSSGGLSDRAASRLHLIVDRLTTVLEQRHGDMPIVILDDEASTDDARQQPMPHLVSYSMVP